MKLNLKNHRLGLGPAVYRTSNRAGGGGEPAVPTPMTWGDLTAITWGDGTVTEWSGT